jgi:hypothetical protein
MHLMDLLHNLGITDVSLNGWDVRVNFSESCDKRLTPIYSNHRLHSSVTESHSSNANPSTEFNQVPKVGSGAPAVKNHIIIRGNLKCESRHFGHHLSSQNSHTESSIRHLFDSMDLHTGAAWEQRANHRVTCRTNQIYDSLSVNTDITVEIKTPIDWVTGVPPKSHGNQKRGDRKHSPFACAAHPLAGLVSLSLNKKCLKPPTSNLHNWGATSSDASLI